ncbi:MAG: hypothetical protein E7604_01995 [Ruminococcaceae bacterium]|nr:hypothetical protein [Oscillospiraceae bacterium]
MKRSLPTRISAVFLTVLLLFSFCSSLTLSAAYDPTAVTASAVLPMYAAAAVPAAQIRLSDEDGILTLSLQLRGTGIARTQCLALSYDSTALTLLRNDGTASAPTAAITAYNADDYVTVPQGWTSGLSRTVSGGEIPTLEHGISGDRGLLLLYPTANAPQTLSSYKTVLTLRFARVEGGVLNTSSIRLFSQEEQTAASQSVKLMLCTAEDYFTWGSRSGGDTLAAPAFVGHAVIRGTMENDITDPSTSWSNPFVDITESLLYYDAIAYVAQMGLFVGNDKNQFLPDDPMNRATFATVLCRLAGDEAAANAAPPTESVFPDVRTQDWFAPYVTWSVDEGLFYGYGDGRFGPNDPITHEQMYLLMQRFALSRGYLVRDGADADLTSLSDAADVSTWAVDAVKFARANGLLLPDANRAIRPTQPAARWELAVLLQSLSEIARTETAAAELSDAMAASDIPAAPPASDEQVRGARQTIYNGLLTLSEKINLSSYHLNLEQLAAVYIDAAKQPEFFYVDNLYHYSYNQATGEIISVRPNYAMQGAALLAAQKQYTAALHELLTGVDENWSDYEKVLYLHDLLVVRYVYDETLGSFDALSLLTGGRGVCQAYTLVMQALLNTLGIENSRVTSEEMNHTWNLVRLNGNWYHLDVTWDDPQYDQYGQVHHTYFLKSDAYMLKHEHYGWSSFEPKTCTDTRYDNSAITAVRTPLVPAGGGLWYFISNANGSIYKWNPVTNVCTLVHATGMKWTTASGTYQSMFTGLIRIGDILVYNSADAILAYHLDTGITETVHKTTAAGYICGLTLQNTADSAGNSIPYLVYQVKASPIDAAGQLLRVSAANLFSYSITGTIRGYFADAATKVSLIRNGTTYKTLTLPRTAVFLETEQSFSLDGVKPGRYDLVVEKKGCFVYTVKQIDVSAYTDLTAGCGVLTLLCGDINSDGKINDADRALLLHSATFRRPRELAQTASADCNGDGIIDIVDDAILTDADRFGLDKSVCIVSHAA